MATLLAIGYGKESTAAEAAEEVQHLREDLLIQPDAVAVITRDTRGDYHVNTNHHAVGVGASWGMFWGLLFGLLFFVPVFGLAIGAGFGALLGKIEQGGINREFQQQVRDLVAPGTSALFMIVEEVTPEQAVAALSKYGGTVLRSSFSREQEAQLQEALHGSLSGAGA